jgi:hypothetical protein
VVHTTTTHPDWPTTIGLVSGCKSASHLNTPCFPSPSAQMEPRIRDDPSNWSLPVVAELRGKVAKALHVALHSVLVSVPYVVEDSHERRFGIEKLAYRTLRMGLDLAMQRCALRAASPENDNSDGDDCGPSHYNRGFLPSPEASGSVSSVRLQWPPHSPIASAVSEGQP